MSTVLNCLASYWTEGTTPTTRGAYISNAWALSALHSFVFHCCERKIWVEWLSEISEQLNNPHHSLFQLLRIDGKESYDTDDCRSSVTNEQSLKRMCSPVSHHWERSHDAHVAMRLHNHGIVRSIFVCDCFTPYWTEGTTVMALAHVIMKEQSSRESCSSVSHHWEREFRCSWRLKLI